jgi:hypothetical protein
VGFHRYGEFLRESEEEEIAAVGDENPAVSALVSETEFEFLTRRALEEARLAQIAPSPASANAHRYLAAAYSEQLAKYIKVNSELENLLAALP